MRNFVLNHVKTEYFDALVDHIVDVVQNLGIDIAGGMTNRAK